MSSYELLRQLLPSTTEIHGTDNGIILEAVVVIVVVVVVVVAGVVGGRYKVPNIPTVIPSSPYTGTKGGWAN